MEPLAKRFQAGWKIRSENFSPEIYCAYPRKTKAVSVTGSKCELHCSHCGGHYLKGMTPLADALAGEDNAASYLISGGCDRFGKVPVAQHIEKIKQLKHDKQLNLHVGLVDQEDIAAIAQVADKVSFDFIGDNETVHEVLGLNRSVEDYVACYRNLRKQCSVIPHICIGLRGGQISGEYKAMELLKDMGVEGLTFIVFMPTPGTNFAAKQPPDIGAVLDILLKARKEFPNVHLGLGCMRPGGSYRAELDSLAVRAGINSIVNPVPEAVRVAEYLGLSVVKREECCVF
ncbi:MAG: hypothetical protein ABFC84_11670 [Veillonellales bacterium]